jgi:hypothetical protein
MFRKRKIRLPHKSDEENEGILHITLDVFHATVYRITESKHNSD